MNQKMLTDLSFCRTTPLLCGSTFEEGVTTPLLRGSTFEEVRTTPPLRGTPPEEGNGTQAFRGVSSGEGRLRNTQNYMGLPYNPILKKYSKKLRKAGNLSEVLFWNQVKNKQFKGLDFDRQKIIGNYIVDFYCANCNVVIEIDGSSHDNKQEYDAKRDAYLKSLGLEVIHIPVDYVKRNISAVMSVLYNHPAFQPPRQPSAATPPEEGNLCAP